MLQDGEDVSGHGFILFRMPVDIHDGAALEDVVVGGSAAPRSMIETFEKMGVNVNHAWGMTEMSPIGTHGVMPPWVNDLPFDEKMNYKQLQGRRCFGVDLKIVDDAGQGLPHDGETPGRLMIRGPAIASGYYGEEADALKRRMRTGTLVTTDQYDAPLEAVATVQVEQGDALLARLNVGPVDAITP